MCSVNICYNEPVMEFLEGKTVLLTGAAGFVGSHLADACLAAGATVIGVDNFLTGRTQNIAHLESNDRFKIITADVSRPVHEYLPEKPKVDVVLHFASPASPPRYQAHPIETYLVNSLGTHQLLQYVLEVNPAARVVFASTSEVYGDPKIHPQPEEYWGNVNPNGERSCYDEAKRLGESICGVHQRNFGLDVRIVRIFNTYGPRMDPTDGRVIPNLISQALKNEPMTLYGDGMQTRSYCYVSDLVAGILKLASKDGIAGATINIGNPEEFTIAQTAEEIYHSLHGQESKPEFAYRPMPSDDPTRRKPVIEKARSILSWEPQVSFADGLKKTIEYFKTASN